MHFICDFDSSGNLLPIVQVLCTWILNMLSWLWGLVIGLHNFFFSLVRINEVIIKVCYFRLGVSFTLDDIINGCDMVLFCDNFGVFHEFHLLQLYIGNYALYRNSLLW